MKGVVHSYGQAWVKKDSKLIGSLFTTDATYHEQVLSDPIRGRRNIQSYWQNRVGRGQKNIEFKILNLYIDGMNVIAEWQAKFDVVRTNTRILMKQVAILEFSGRKIASLREYWSSRPIGKAGIPRSKSRIKSDYHKSYKKRRRL
ncbi:MAG: nuclear transport factor 2 family protein [Alphaproteobacteria bacterium GM202ARS2]|nr:nuclear transport factor 2 family protein [Alphaproteobacteria bacterium GM202ARS2]